MLIETVGVGSRRSLLTPDRSYYRCLWVRYIPLFFNTFFLFFLVPTYWAPAPFWLQTIWNVLHKNISAEYKQASAWCWEQDGLDKVMWWIVLSMWFTSNWLSVCSILLLTTRLEWICGCRTSNDGFISSFVCRTFTTVARSLSFTSFCQLLSQLFDCSL